MNERYIILFTELAHSLEILSELALEEESSDKDENKIQAATTMREKYMKIYDKLRNNRSEELTISDFAHLYIAASILINQLEERKNKLELAIRGYKIDILPKLERILNETKNNIDVNNLVKELFSIEEKKEEIIN